MVPLRVSLRVSLPAVACLFSYAVSGLAATFQEQADLQDRQEEIKPSVSVDGAKNPELLPEPIVWDNVFAALHDFMSGEAADGFVRANLFMSSEDGRILKRGVERARAAVKQRQDRLDGAFRADAPDVETAELRRQVDSATLEGRDEILRSLSPLGAKALLRWVAVIKFGMSHEEPAP